MKKFLALLAIAFISASVTLPVSAHDSSALDDFATTSLNQPVAYISWYVVYICAVNPSLPICRAHP